MKRYFQMIAALGLIFLFLVEYPCTALAGYAQIYLKESSSASNPSYPLAKFEPAYGALVGATFDKDYNINGQIDMVDDVYGRPYSAVLIYTSWGDPFPTYLFDEAKANGTAVQLSWEPGWGLEAVNDDAYVRNVAHILANFNDPVFLRFGGEMNGDWTPWSMQPELYKEKFRLIAAIMREEAPNVAMVWSPNYVPDEIMDQYYPGDYWVDWVGINGYADYYFIGNPTYVNQSWTWTKFFQGYKANPLIKYQKMYDTYSARKPIMISETGVAWANRRPYQLVENWAASTLQQIYGYIPLLYPRIKAVYYFNSGVAADFSSYNVSESPTMTAAYKKAIASSYYLEDYSKNSSFYYHVLGSWLPSQISDLAAYVYAGEQEIATVEYYLDGKLIGRSYTIPWEVPCLFRNTGGTSTLEVRGLNREGTVVARQTMQIKVPMWQPIGVELDGKTLNFDVPPVLYNNRTMVPVRLIAETLGLKVEWNDYEQAVVINDGQKNMKIYIAQQKVLINGNQVESQDFAAKVVEDRTLLPLRFISENFGLKVDWDESANMVRLTK